MFRATLEEANVCSEYQDLRTYRLRFRSDEHSFLVDETIGISDHDEGKDFRIELLGRSGKLLEPINQKGNQVSVEEGGWLNIVEAKVVELSSENVLVGIHEDRIEIELTSHELSDLNTGDRIRWKGRFDLRSYTRLD